PVRQDPVLVAYRFPDFGRQPCGGYGLLRPPALRQILLGASDDRVVDLACLCRSLGGPSLQIAVHGALTQTRELAQHRRSAAENRDISRHEPAVTAGPRLDSILSEADTNELGAVADDALMAPAEPRSDPRQTRRNDAFRLRPRQRSFDVLDPDRD